MSTFTPTEEQQKIYDHDGNALVTASAGGGKTSTIVQKICQITKNNPTKKVLYLTFTRKAKEEAIERIGKNSNVRVTNFHGLAYGVLNNHKQFLQVSDIDIIPDSYEYSIMSELFPGEKTNEIRKRLEVVHSYKENYKKLSDLSPMEKAIFVPFQRVMDSTKKLSYSDLVYKFNELIETKNLAPYVKAISLTFDYIFVDEVQDTNRSQYVMLQLLKMLNPECKMCFIGDVDQSLYGFRFSKPEQVFDLIDTYSPKLLTLSKNFRCQQTIVDFGNIFLANCSQFASLRKGLMTSSKPRGDTVKWIYFETPDQQYSYVCKTIHDMVANGECKYSEVSILFRMNKSGIGFEKAAIKEKLPLHLLRGSLMSRTEVKYLLSLIRVGYELNKEVMDEPDFIKQVAILSDELAADIGEESFNLVCKLNNGMNLLEKIKNIDTLNIAGIGPKRKVGFIKFYEKLTRVKQEYARIEKDGISTFLNYCVDEILEFKFAKKATKMVYDLIEDTLRDINALILDIEGNTLIDRVGTFVVEFSGEESSEVKDKVLGMTVHKAKGTENKVVFIIDFTDFPATFSSDEEEEKRVLYVAVTRAKEKLYLTSSGYRFIYLDLIRDFKYLETNVPMDTINTEDFYKKTERYDLWK